MRRFLLNLLPQRLRARHPLVHAVRLHGAIGVGSPLRPALTLQSLEPLLTRAFAGPHVTAVALLLNSPGGSAVQSAMIHDRIRALAAKHRTPVLVFCEDVAASGGYWIACAGDEIYADRSSIVGSIGVISASFGFVEAIGRLGIERRVHTAGENKAILDPFQPEKPEDVARLTVLQREVHETFKAHVRERRGTRLGQDPDLFTGAFWAGTRARELGLIDGIGHARAVIEARFGPKVTVKAIEKPQGFGLRRLGFGAEIAASALETLEARGLWARYGL